MENEVWFRPLVWIDYRLAVLFTVLLPLALFIWSFVKQVEVVQRLLSIYWRVASLLAITNYLMIAQYPVSFITSLMGLILIPISLWFWVDLNDEIEYQPDSRLKLAFTSWRWAATFYCIVNAIASLPFLGCAFSETSLKSSYCGVWFEPPLLFKSYLHNNTKPAFLGGLAIIGLIIYVLCLCYFVIVKLGKQGRSAIQ
ncbi:DUF3177 family protein [Calothrix sp. PCC 6303]|uniref:DUF3177 family protein n=1 Tax=Calothrix sp. PCC 6303 TaxID=1170562 RepID=UPI0002A01C04|nr:DUF3177 family protein [Calothrix sp. PCC 6303]AFZ04180.1 hypothetical protein Cal6303_5294 [Calothrix sp. PCC 6303]